jgi:hypothetical protein
MSEGMAFRTAGSPTTITTFDTVRVTVNPVSLANGIDAFTRHR